MTKVFGKGRSALSGILAVASVVSLMAILTLSEPAQAQYMGENTKEAVQNTSALPANAQLPGVNTAGTVRTMNLANLEALLNIGANGTELLGVIWGACLFLTAFKKASSNKRSRLAMHSAVLIMGGLATPNAMNWFVSMARDLNMFS